MTGVADVSGASVAELVSLAGRGAVVTGAAQGLGRAIAARLAEAGANVLLADLNLDLATAEAAELDARWSGKVRACALDASDAASVAAAAARAQEEFGPIDIWVNNAGIFPNKPITAMDVDEWDRVQAVNARGTFLGAQAAIRAMKQAGKGGVVINIASLAGIRGIAPGLSAYVGSKHAVVGLTRQLALEVAPLGIRVLAIAPSFMVTEGNMAMIQADPRMAEAAGEAIPSMLGSKLGRVGLPDDIARVALFCASDLSLFMSGAVLPVDAGETA